MTDYKLDAGSVPGVVLGGAHHRVLHLSSTQLPEYRFEFVPATSQVVAIKRGLTPEVGTPIAGRVGDPELAQVIVQAWCHGYFAARERLILK